MPVMTFVRGNLVYDGKFFSNECIGKLIKKLK